VRRYIIFFTLCLIFFILPLQVFIIGGNVGIGIQGAVYRFQITEYGDYFFPITREIFFVINGTYFGKSALSVLLWLAGSILIACVTIFSFAHVNDTTTNYFRQLMQGLVVASMIYLGSIIAQYGFLFHGPAGLSLPIGIFLILGWIGIFYFYRDTISKFWGSK